MIRKPGPSSSRRPAAPAALLEPAGTGLLDYPRVDTHNQSTYFVYMKAVQITMDEDLLERLDSVDEVKKKGRSAVIRMVLAEWLRRKRSQAIDERYRVAYADGDPLGKDWAGWEEQGAWTSDT